MLSVSVGECAIVLLLIFLLFDVKEVGKILMQIYKVKSSIESFFINIINKNIDGSIAKNKINYKKSTVLNLEKKN